MMGHRQVMNQGIEVDVINHRHQIRFNPREVARVKRQLNRRQRRDGKREARQYL